MSRRTIVAIAAMVTLLAGACGGSDGSSDGPTTSVDGAIPLVEDGTPVAGGAIVIGVTGETDGWNPAFAQWVDAGNLVGASVFEPLFIYDTEGNTVPWLAESATPNDNFTEWTITIRPGISFHDGTPMTAEALASSIRIGAKDGLSAMVIGSLIVDVTANDELSFTVTTAEPWPTFLNNLTTQIGLAAAPAMYEAEDGMADHPIGTGPYVFKSWTPDESFKVSKNEEYWGGPCSLESPGDAVRQLCDDLLIPPGQPNGPFFDDMEFRPIPDGLQRMAALQAGDVDMMFTIGVPVAAEGTDYTVITDDGSEKTLLQLNTAEAPFDNEHARKALAYAANPAAAAALVSPNRELVIDTSPFSQQSKWGLPRDQTGYPEPDVESAKAEVAAYLEETGADKLSFTMKGLATVEDQTVLQILQQQFAEAGIEANIETIEQVSLLTTIVGGQFQSVLLRNYSYPDPDSQYFFFAESTAQGPLFINFSQYTTSEIEQALLDGRGTTNFDDRKAAYDTLVKARNEAVTDIWLYNTPYTLVANPEIRGLNPFRMLPWGNFVPKQFIGGVWSADS